jgi:hypothetical protein
VLCSVFHLDVFIYALLSVLMYLDRSSHVLCFLDDLTWMNMLSDDLQDLICFTIAK